MMAGDPERFQKWFSPADLPDNRAGHLAPDQARRLGLEAKVERGWNWLLGIVLFAAGVILLGLEVSTGGSAFPAASAAAVYGAAVVVILLGLFFTASGYRGRFNKAVAQGAVEHVSGPAALHLGSRNVGREGHVPVYELRVGLLQFDLDGHLFGQLKEGEPLTAYYLGGHLTLVNLESADVPAQAPADVAAADAASGPPDGTPLPQAIIGRWRLALGGPMAQVPITVEFRPDGTAVLTPDLSDGSLLAALPEVMRGAASRMAQPHTIPYRWTDADHIEMALPGHAQAEAAQVHLTGGQLIIDTKDGEQHLVRLPDAVAPTAGQA